TKNQHALTSDTQLAEEGGKKGRSGEDGTPGLKGLKGEGGLSGLPGREGSEGVEGPIGNRGTRGLQTNIFRICLRVWPVLPVILALKVLSDAKGDWDPPGPPALESTDHRSGPQGPQGVQGEKGPLGEGLPGPKGITDLQVLPAYSASPEPEFKERRATKGSREKRDRRESEEQGNREGRVNPGQQESVVYQDFQEKTGLPDRRVNLALLVFEAQKELLESAPRVKRETKAREGSEDWPVLLVSLDPPDQRVNQGSLDGLDYQVSLAVASLVQRGISAHLVHLVLLEKLVMDILVLRGIVENLVRPALTALKGKAIQAPWALLDYRVSSASRGSKD
ncbi:hypothetical protein NHX12_014924, partial [Muraenolepis orangiensis]